MEAKETEEVPLTLEELNLAIDSSFMLSYLEKRSQKFQDNPDMVFGYVQGWKDRKKYEAWFFRNERNINIISDFMDGWSIRRLSQKYYLSQTQIRRIIKKKMAQKGE